MKLKQSERQDLQDWDVVCRMLPQGWAVQARTRGALRRARGIGDAETLLRVLLIHLIGGCSLKETSVRAQRSGLAKISSVAIHKRLIASQEWLRWMAVGLRSQLHGKIEDFDRPLRIFDATTISEPGSTGTDWRVHYSINLATLQCDFFELTDVKGGEKLQRFPVHSGDVILADRAYASSRGVDYIIGEQGDVVIRWYPSRSLVDEQARKVNFLELSKGLKVGQVRECSVGLVNDKGNYLPGRLIIIKRTRKATEYARKRMRKKLRRRDISPTGYREAQYFYLWTTVSKDAASAEKLLQLYQMRWQIELAFKRLKSIMGLGHLPKKDPSTARAWLHGKLLAGLLVQRSIQQAGSFSPWGYPLDKKT